ncbi:MAG: DNA-directed RNA polymerase subunit alpha [Campylobacteraceae bacterium]|nr:DNA-directed RNA polymerase subunit alpha [Campylobacteraceae bacterium]
MTKINTSAYMPTNLDVVNAGENRVRISAYPFESGFGITLAHPLRRLLYSSTVGFAPTSVKIEGVTHEFDSMRGMFEDVAHFIINLKSIRFKIKDLSTSRVTANYSFKGTKEIKGVDLMNDELDIVTPDIHLASINEDAELNFTVVIEKGIGYVPSEIIREQINDGFIALDAFFTPVKRAIYDIENILVEDNPDYEKVIFTIETDGQISPVDAFKHSLKAMYSQMSVFNNVLEADVISQDADGIDSKFASLLQKISDLNLSVRSFNSLDKAQIKYVAEIALLSEHELKDLKNLGKKSFDEIKSIMEEIGFPVGTISTEIAEVLRKKITELKANKE